MMWAVLVIVLALVAWIVGNHNNDDDNWPQPPAVANLKGAW